MIVSPTSISEVLLVTPEVHADPRGSLVELWHAPRYADAGMGHSFVQDNHSRSVQCVLRGLHYQVNRPQGKLIHVATGAIFDVAVDLRRSSPTFGRWTGVILSEERHQQLWIPPGFGHGFYVLSAVADVIYKCTEPHVQEHARAIRWDDATLAIQWPLPDGTLPLLSPKDREAPLLREAEVFP